MDLSNRNPPKIFMSYSWSSREHQEWVLDLAHRLTSDGIHVIIDAWDLKEGHDKHVFMEQMVTDESIGRVLVILDHRYAEKADKREGGVGSESQIISAELYGKVDQKKFIPVVATTDEQGNPYLPVYLRTRIYINLSSKEHFATEYEKLLRNIYDRPAKQRPALGARPAFIDEPNPLSSVTRFRLQAFMDAGETGGRQARGHLHRFLAEVISSLPLFKISAAPTGELDEVIFDLIHQMKPLRDELLRAAEQACLFNLSEAFDELHWFLEQAASFLFRPAGLQSWQDGWFDQYKFFLREFFLHLSALFLRYKRFDELNKLLSSEYCYKNGDKTECDSYPVFDQGLKSFAVRNQRLKLNRLSLAADLIKERADFPQLSFEDLMQADVILTLKQRFDDISSLRGHWYPDTGVFLENRFDPLPFFARASSGKDISALKALFSVGSLQDFALKFDKISGSQGLQRRRHGIGEIPYDQVLGLEQFRRQG